MTEHPGNPAAGSQGLDLSAVRSRSQAETAPAAPAGGAPAGGAPAAGADTVSVPALVFDVTEETFNDVVELSMSVPVVVDLWADWCGPCKQLSPVLDKVVSDFGGKVVLAKVDVDKNPRLQQVFQVQSIPTVVAILKGQPVPLFQGAQPEPQVRQVFEQLVAAAAQNGVTKTAVPASEQAPAAAGPAHPEAIEALERDDLDGAEQIYRKALAEAPADEEARLGLARVGLLKRVKDADPEAVRAAAASDSTDVDAALACADLDTAGGHVDDAFNRLLTILPSLTGDDKERVRTRLVELFDVVGAEDPRVMKARSRLMRALF
ncbi:tetratricopeptide repeat protein [Brevibacterium luteolum]|uniref:tetratricopeptide repeat protein n=1 Tax=Brevibacterium luteolum TaxID=199591 RepID=UPI00223B0E1E|nr:tetratricopeptide repeat protein [Brevibacterium luteolum]MCT1921393.1 tetratricopeptide repeat protein [Brevibacterium luteolum]